VEKEMTKHTKASLFVPILDLTPAKRCSDYDADCAEVISPVACWQGCETSEYFTEEADGYCPYMVGEK
jgi:hypothetical protein